MDGGQWLLVSELVEGTHFLRYVRSPAKSYARLLDRLRPALVQLAQGLRYLHARGRLHGDLKPSNVLVTAEGSVRLVDFGLVEELAPGDGSPTSRYWGTPAYAAPELQLEAGPPSPATDWYSFGVLLYEALTGQRPGPGCRRPGCECADVPADLDRLTERLLATESQGRPTGDEVLRRLGAVPREPASMRALPLFGRDEELHELGEAFDVSCRGVGTVVWIEGGSGTGKTALVQHFLEGLRYDPRRAVVLSGRCHPHEAVPYKTFDSLVDSLTRHLLALEEAEVTTLLTERLESLVRLFPVLRRVPALAAAAPANAVPFPDPQQRRRRAFRALRELLHALAHRSPLVLFIDDLQWGDADSAPLFVELVRPPAAPMLLLCSYRSEDTGSSALFQALSRRGRHPLGSLRARRLRLGPLAPEPTRRLSRWLLGRRGEVDEGLVARIEQESGGNPLFVDALCRRALATGAATPHRADELTLERVLREEIGRLPAPAARLLEVVALAGRPLDVEVARRAAGLEIDEGTTLRSLQHARLIQIRPGSMGPRIDLFHDRWREAVVARLGDEQIRGLHRRLATVLEDSGRADPAALVLHYQATRESRRAAEYAIAGAEAAFEQDAFARGARLLELVLELQPHAALPELRRRLGDALRHAGRGAEAADAYLDAVKAGSREVVELQRLAAEQLLLSGHFDRGLQVLRHVLRTIDMELPSSRSRLRPRLLLHRLAVRRCPLDRRGRRSAATLDPETLRRIDTCWSAAVGLAGIDPLRASEFHAEHFVLAHRAGEPSRYLRALALEAAFAVADGNGRRGQRLLEIATQRAEALGDAHALARVALASTLRASSLGTWSQAAALADQAERLLRERCTGVSWELAVAHHLGLQALFSLGDMNAVAERLPGLLAEAEDRGDLYAECVLRKWNARACLLADDAETARAELRRAEDLWPTGRRFDQPFNAMLVEGDIALYEGCGELWWHTRARWRQVKASGVLSIQFLRVRLYDLRARAALVAASRLAPGCRGRRKLVRAAAREARRVGAVRLPWAQALASLTWAAVRSERGDVEGARRHYEDAIAHAAACAMAPQAAAARWRLGLLCGAAGRELAAGSLADLERLGVARPERFCALLAPVP